MIGHRMRSRTFICGLRLEPLERRDVPSFTFDPVTGRGQDEAGNVFYALTELPNYVTAPRDGPIGPRNPPFDLTQTFLLHSQPFAKDV